MSYEPHTEPLRRISPPRIGFFNLKRGLLLGVAVISIGALAAFGLTIQGEYEEEDDKVSDVTPATLNVSAARPFTAKPQSSPQDTEYDSEAGEPVNATNENDQSAAAVTPTTKGPPQGFQKISPVVMRGNAAQRNPQGQGGVRHASHEDDYRQNDNRRSQQGGGYPGEEGHIGSEDYESQGDGSRGRGGKSRKESFYAGGGAAMTGGLDVAGQMVGELPGCVVKAGEQIILQTRSRVRTTLPQRILGYVVNPVEGNHYLGNGEVERCLAIPAGSTILSEVNSSGVERGDLRIQACALRLDLLGGGRRVLGCQPAHGADGGAGIEADSDYAVTGIISGIIIEASLASARGLGGLIAGPAGVAVQVGTNGISQVGSEYVRRELMRPPVLTMDSGAIYGVQLNGDLSLPLS